MNNLSKDDKQRIKELFFNRGYGIDELAHKYRKKYEHAQIRSYIFDVIEREQ